MSRALQELRIALRTILKNPAFAVIVVLCIGLAVGANTTIFAVVNKVLLKAMPYPDPDRLMMIWESNPQRGLPRMPVRPANFQEWKDRTHSFEDIAYSRDFSGVDLTGNGEPEAVNGYRFSANMFKVLGLNALIGRTFLPEDVIPGAAPVVVLNYKLWARRFGKDANVLGKTLTIAGKPYTIIGVMPPEFQHPQTSELWVPYVLQASDLQNRKSYWFRLVGRLRPGVSKEDAQRELTALSRQLAAEHPDTNAGWTAQIVSLREMYVGDIRNPLILLLCAVGLLLLVAVANVANLMLARMHARSREISVRIALGAGRADLIRQLLSESLLLSFFGGILGVLFALWATRGLVALFPTNLNNLGIPQIDKIPIDSTVLAFSTLLLVLTALMFGLPAAFRGSNPDLASTLKDSTSASGTSKASKWLRQALVVAEIAIAVVVLIGAGLTIKSFAKLQQISFGFDASHVLSMYIQMPQRRYPTADNMRTYMDKLQAELSRLPGVQSVGAISYLPLSGYSGGVEFQIEGVTSAPQDLPTANVQFVTPKYFDSMGIRLLSGRVFLEGDTKQTPEVGVVNQQFARRYFGQKDPVGTRINVGTLEKPEWIQIVGVLRDVKHDGVDQETPPELYFDFYQAPSPLMAFTIKTQSDPNSLANAARQAIWSVDKDQPVTRMLSIENAVDESLAIRRITMLLLALFALASLMLATVGTYGVIAQAVAQRTREIGVRMALGATRNRVMRMVLGEGARLTGAGLVIGVALALAATRLMKSLLFGVSAYDPLTFVAIPFLLCTVALLACFIPARRATTVDPMVALRYE